VGASFVVRLRLEPEQHHGRSASRRLILPGANLNLPVSVVPALHDATLGPPNLEIGLVTQERDLKGAICADANLQNQSMKPRHT